MSEGDIDDYGKTQKGNPGKDGYADTTGAFPKREYIDVASTNLAARGLKRNELYIGGGDVDLNLDLRTNGLSTYPLNQVRETVSGHVTEIDDTPGSERILYKHRTGAGVEMRPDGTVIVSSRYNTIQITGNDHKVIVEGDGDIHYNGNLRLHVAGNMDVEVGGDYNLRVHGDKREDIRGGVEQKVVENHETRITGNKSSYVLGTNSDIVLSDNNSMVKGNNTERVQGKQAQYVGDDILITAANDYNLTSPSVNIAATDLSAISTTGIIGGDNVIYYAKNYYGTSATFTAGVTAPTFSGDLTGKADDANQADFATSAGEAPLGVAGNPGTNTHVDTDTTVRTAGGQSINAPGPNSAIMSAYLNASELGVRNVQIDQGDAIRDTVNKSVDYGGISKVRLTTDTVRSKLRDPNTSRNSDFIGRCISEGILSASYVEQKPQSFDIGRIFNKDATAVFPKGKTLGNQNIQAERIAGDASSLLETTLIPNQLYNPEFQMKRDGVITGKTKLGRGITVAKFCGGYADPATLEHITDDIDRLQIARNLYANAEFIRQAQEFLDKGNKHRLIVAEGLYKKEAGETLDVDSLNFLASRGQVVVYELRDLTGNIDVPKTFELAVYCKDYTNFDKMILDYDSYNPDGSLNAQLIIQMPPCNPDWKMRYRNDIETRYNNYTQTNGELVEII